MALDVCEFLIEIGVLVFEGAVDATAEARCERLVVDLFPNVPVEAEVVAVEGAQAADGLIEGGGGELPFVLKVDEEVEHAVRGKRGEILIGEVTA